MTDDLEPTKREPLSFSAMVLGGLLVCGVIYAVFGPSPSPAPQSPQLVESPKNASDAHIGGQYVMRGTRVHMTETVPACSTLDNLTKFRELATDGDREAVVKLIQQGGCQLLDKGATVTVQDSSVWKDAECVRIPGETTCLWTPVKATDGRME